MSKRFGKNARSSISARAPREIVSIDGRNERTIEVSSSTSSPEGRAAGFHAGTALAAGVRGGHAADGVVAQRPEKGRLCRNRDLIAGK